MFSPRYHNGAYRDCKWCHGKGCNYCKSERDKEYKRQFPDGPTPLLTIPIEDFDRLVISEMTGGPTMADAHGDLGKLCEAVFNSLREQGTKEA